MTNAIRILVADDEPTSRLLMQAALENAGFEIELAVDGLDALEKFRARPCDMAMLDVEMPGLDGYQLCMALRAEAGGELPIIMVTGMDDLGSIERAYESGATDFMPKPLNWSLIGHRVKYLHRAYQNLLELRTANARNTAILDAIPDWMAEFDLEGRFLDYHFPRSDLRPGLEGDLLGRTMAEVVHPDAARIGMAALQEAHAKGHSTGKQFELQLKRGPCWFELSVARKSGPVDETSRFVMLARDITERKEAESRIYKLAYFDKLTGLPNRQSFLERLTREVQRAEVHGSTLGVLFLGIDGFKNINDTLGHVTGDQVLQWLADRLRLGMRPSDIVARVDSSDAESGLARLGGDEFTVLLPNMKGSDDALVIAQRIRELMRQPFNLDGRELVLTVSIGVAVFPGDGNDAETLLKHADTALYHAKNKGRDNCQFYSESLTQQALHRLNMTNGLRLALERDEFFLAYQPQYDVASGRIHSVEALIRWRHPEQGLVSPATFIPLAEETGLIVPIGAWVLRTACRDAAAWNRAGMPVRMAVNLSAVQFRNQDLLHTIRQVLQETGLPPEQLELEVTEGALMDDGDVALATLRTLRAGGMLIALDDFGTGYSSMSYLKRLPLHNLKVDQSFVRGLPDDKDSHSIVKAVVSLAKNLGFTVTAEGVETLEQARLLIALECETLQGYYFSKPIPGGDIPAVLQRTWRAELSA